jgi:hypothetical protein
MARVGEQEPSARVWRRIRRDLEADKPPQQRLRLWWPSLVLQSVLTLALMTIGGVGLQTLLNTGTYTPAAQEATPSVTLVAAVEPGRPLVARVVFDESDKRLLRSLPRTVPAASPPTDTLSPAPIPVPRDAPPSAFSPEGRARKVMASSFALAVEDDNLLHSGPYRWHR